MWNCYVDKSDPKPCYSDLIIKQDLMLEMGKHICFCTADVKQNNISTSIQSGDKLDKQLVSNFEKESIFRKENNNEV